MADKESSYIEQLKELRSLRMQQLKGMTAEQKYYTNTINNQRALLQAQTKLANSFDSMSKTFVSSIKGLSNAIGGLASRSASAAGSAAGGVASVAGSISTGLSKVLPFAIAGLLGKLLVWDNLTGDTKDKLTSSISNLFSRLFGGLPNILRNIVQSALKTISDMDIKFPIFDTLLQKTQIFVKLLTTGFEYVKLKFEDMMEFFGNIKDPMSLIEKGFKAFGATALARLLLPATVSLVGAVIKNRYLMMEIEAAMSGIGGRGGLAGGGRAGGGVGGRVRRAGAAATGAAAVSAARVAAGRSVATKIAARIGTRLTSGAVLAAIPVVGELVLLGYTAYEIYEIAKELGFTDDEAEQLKQEAEMKTDAFDYYGPRIDEKKAGEIQGKVTELEKLKKTEPNPALSIPEQEAQRTEIQSKIDRLTKEVAQASDIQEIRKKQKRAEDSAEGDVGVYTAFYRVWNALSKDEKMYFIDNSKPIIETENYVYMMGKDRKIFKMKIDEYLKMRNELDPLIPEVDRATIEQMTGKIIRENEAPGGRGQSSYDVVYGYGKYGKPDTDLSKMTGEQVMAFQKNVLVPNTRAAGIGIRDGKVVGTGAVGAYQFNQGNLIEYYNKNEKEKGNLFDAEQQDKIYRWLIKNAVDQFLVDGDKEKFKKSIAGTWEIFKTDQKAKDQLDALLNNPAFTAGAGEESGRKSTKEERAKREKLLEEMIGTYSKQLVDTNVDTTLMTVKGESVVEKAKEQAREAMEDAKNKTRSMFDFLFSATQNPLDFFQNYQENVDALTDAFKNKSGTTVINYNGDHSTNQNISSSSGGGGGGTSINQIIGSNMRERNWQFNSMAGGNAPN